jgi:hypothetical protein
MSGRDWLWWGLAVLCTAPAWGTLIWFLNELYFRPLLSKRTVDYAALL